MDSSPLTLIHLLEPGGGGTMRHVIDLAQEQAKHGHTVHIIYSPLRLEPLFAPQLLALDSITLHALPMRRAPHVSDIQNLFSLIKILGTIRPDILHAHSTKAGMLARTARLFVKTKVIYTPHALMTMNPETSAIQKFCYGIYEKLLLPFMHRMIVLSSYEYEHALSLGIPHAKLVMGLNGIAPLTPAHHEKILSALPVAEEDVVIGFVGRLSHQKNPQLALQAFATARQKNQNLKFAIIGDGELRTVCEALAQELKISSDILWLGAVDAKEFYFTFDILLITSRFEGMAYTYLEALQAGLPVISTRVGGTDSCIIHGQTGIVTEADATEVAEAILLLANDATMRDAMHFTCRAHAKHFTLAEMYRYHQLIYHGD